MRMVEPVEWDLTGMRDQTRRERLMAAPDPVSLVAMVAKAAENAAMTRRASLTCETGEEMRGCHRAIMIFPGGRDLFDWLFNGHSGYRAQYYLSCDEGRAV